MGQTCSTGSQESVKQNNNTAANANSQQQQQQHYDGSNMEPMPKMPSFAKVPTQPSLPKPAPVRATRGLIFGFNGFSTSPSNTKPTVMAPGSPAAGATAPVVLIADGKMDAIAQIHKVLGSWPEGPDADPRTLSKSDSTAMVLPPHSSFGPHITQVMDEQLGIPVFQFHLHCVNFLDSDRCRGDRTRQRVEIKTDKHSPANTIYHLNDTAVCRWRFKIPRGFQPSNAFTHIHQVIPGDGDKKLPFITLCLRKKKHGDVISITWNNGQGNGEQQSGRADSTTLMETPLDPFVDTWVEAYETMTFSHSGTYSLEIRRMCDNEVLLQYNNPAIDVWRAGGTSFARLKWGVYRSLLDKSNLRDEDDFRYGGFSIGKGGDQCALPPVPRLTVVKGRPSGFKKV